MYRQRIASTILLQLLPHAQCPRAALVEPVSGSGLSALRMVERIALRDTQFAELVRSSMLSHHAPTMLVPMQTALHAYLTGILLFERTSLS